MTQMELARQGKVTEAMAAVAKAEGLEAEAVRRDVATGQVAIPANKNRRSARLMGVGRGLRVKVNANLGTSPDYADVEMELQKLAAAQDAGADAIMDLSTGGDIPAIRRRLMDACEVTVGTVPIYEAAACAGRPGCRLVDRDRADADVGRLHDAASDGAKVAAGREVHDGVGARVLSNLELLKLDTYIGIVRARAKVRVDLDAKPLTDAHDALCAAVLIEGDGDPAFGHQTADGLDVHALGGRHGLHGLGNLPLPCEFHLCHADDDSVSPRTIRAVA